MLTFHAFCLLSLGLVTQSGDALSATQSIAGHVVCPEPGDLAGIEVQLWSTEGSGSTAQVRTGSDGSFRFERRPTSAEWLLVDDWTDARGELWSAAAQVPTDSTKPISLELRRGGLVHGRVSDDQGILLGPAGLSLSSGWYGRLPSDPDLVASDANGGFAYAGCPPGLWYFRGVLEADPLEYMRIDSFRVPLSGEVRAVVPRRARVAGQIFGPDGVLVGDAKLECKLFHGLSGGVGVQPSADGGGQFDVGWLHSGQTSIYAFKRGYSPSRAWVWTLEPGKSVEGLRFDLKASAKLRVQLDPSTSEKDREGGFEYEMLLDDDPKTGAFVEAWMVGDLGFDSDGLARLEDLPQGVYCIRRRHDDRGPKWLVEVRAGATAEITVGGAPQPMHRVTGLAKDSTGAPAAGLWVRAYVEDDDNELGSLAQTATDGSFSWDFPIAADYVIGVSRSDLAHEVTVQRDLRIDPRSNQRVEIALSGTVVRGRVLEGQPPAPQGAYLTVERAPHRHGLPFDRLAGVGNARSGLDGVFEVKDLPPGRYRLRAVSSVPRSNSGSEWFEAQTPWFDLGKGQTLEGLELTLAPVPTTAIVVR